MYARFVEVLIIATSFFYKAYSMEPGYFTIVAPGTIRSHSPFHVSISLSDYHRSCMFNISFTSFNNRNQFYRSWVEIHPNTTKLVTIRVPILKDARGRLEVTGYRGILTKKTAVIHFEPNTFLTFIQTNKAKYKPGELVQFRVICIDQLTRPAEIYQRILILIYDGQENVIKHISDVKPIQGVYKDEFQISNYPVLGEWKIKVEVGGDAAAEKSFEVARYSLPKFLVSIETKPNVAIDEEKIVLEISTNYFYGETVQGNLTIFLNNTYAAFQDKIPIFSSHSKIHEETTIVLDMKNDLHIEYKNQAERFIFLYKFKAEAIVIDDLSGQQSRDEVEIAIHSQPFKIKLQAPKIFDADELLTFKVKASVTDLEDEPIQDHKTSVKIIVECFRPLSFDIEPFKSEYKHPIGIEFTTIKVANQNFSECSLYAEYEGSKSLTEWIKKSKDSLQMVILTESPEVGKELEIKLKSEDPIDNFSYEIVARGDIIQAQHIQVPENQTTHMLRLNVSYAMVPKITIYAHRIHRRVFGGQLKDVYIKRAFQNSIIITTDEEVRPGSSININVTTDEGSYVGLMGLDQRLLQKINNRDDFTEDHLYTRLRTYDALTIDSNPFPGARAGLVTFTNAINETSVSATDLNDLVSTIFDPNAERDDQLPKEFDKPTLEFPRIRKLFSDSWLYKDFERTPAGGFNLMETVPDTISSWALTGFSLNPNTGLTLTKNATNFKVFQEFFVSMELPSFVKEGETIEVPVYVSNYMSQDAWTNVTIESDSGDLEILEQPEGPSKLKETFSKLIPTRSREKLAFFIKPRKSGLFNVTVKAISPAASDAVQKILYVDSEGILHEISKTYLVHFPEESIQEDEISIDIPDNVVPGSQRIEISVVGDIFRPLFRSLEKLARVPYGNGEDNMKLIVSNALVFKYLKALNYSNPSLESKIRLHLELGYQNQLSFKHLDGSFELFDQTIERTGDIWQTAFALWGLKQASEFIEVDLKVFKRGWEYLKSKQQENGCFKSKNDIEEDVKHTALVLMVFLMDKNSRTEYSEVISKGLAFLHGISDNLRQSSISVMSTYVLLLGQHEKAADVLKKLTTNAPLTSKQMLWTKLDNLQARLEMTAGSLMNLFSSQKQPKQNLLHIVRGLIAPEGEESSLTHMLALQAMIVFVEELHLKTKNLNITFMDDQNGSGNFYLNSENFQVLQTSKLSQNSRRINLQSKGYGFGVVDVKFKYNIVPEDQTSATYLTNITTKSISNDSNVLEICLSVLKNFSLNKLTIMEVSLQSGHIFTGSPFEKVREERKNIKLVQVNGSQDKVVIYFENVDSNGACLNLETLRTYKVFNAKSGWVIVYDAHKKDEKTAKSFKIKDS